MLFPLQSARAFGRNRSSSTSPAVGSPRSGALAAVTLGLLAGTFAVDSATSQIIDSTVLPPMAATQGGNGGTSFPWAVSAGNSVRIQYVYDSSHFIDEGVLYPVLIRKLRFRADDVSATWTGGTFSDVKITLSSADVDYTAVTRSFETNHGPDRTVVLQGPVTVMPGTSNTGQIAPWYVDIQLPAAFRFDPQLDRDLLIDIQINAASWSGGSSTPTDVATQFPNPGLPPFPSKCKRVYSLGNHLASQATNGPSDSGPVMEVSYGVETLQPAFRALTRSGNSPLTVQFEDLSATNAPGGIAARAWDFDSDGVVDSSGPNPTWTYTSCGNYDVTLIVLDSTHGQRTRTVTSYIVVDAMEPAFTMSSSYGAPPFTVQFTDQTLGQPNSWAWDFDSNGTVDSTVQNPSWTFQRGDFDVSFTTSNGCVTQSAPSARVVARDVIETTFAGGNGWSTNTPGNLFDLDVRTPTGVSIQRLEVHAGVTLGLTVDVDIYVTRGTHVGKDGNAALWRRVSSGSAISNGRQTMTEVDITNLYLPQGLWGIAIHYPQGDLYYTNGPSTVSTPDMVATFGMVRTDPFGGNAIPNRTWNGRILFDRGPNGGFGYLGSAQCAPGEGPISLLHIPGNIPRIGGALVVAMEGLQSRHAGVLFAIGPSSATWNGQMLPVSTNPAGLFGCALHIAPLATIFGARTGPGAGFVLPIPNDPSLSGVMLDVQGLLADPQAPNRARALMTDAMRARVGN